MTTITPTASPGSRIPSLDGLRALSILFVIVGHAMFELGPRAAAARTLGNVGVRVFFVISGYLITHLLLREREKTGRVSVAEFFLRRCLRILPLAFTYIGLVALGAAFGLFAVRSVDFAWAASFLMSYRLEPSWELAHLWSLSVEEQFYLLWPWAMALVRPPSARRVIWLVLAAGPLLRAAFWALGPDYRLAIGVAFPTVADNIAVGCLAALSPELFEKATRRVPSWAFALVAPLAAWAVITYPESLPPLLRRGVRLFGDSVVNVLLALWVFSSTRARGTWTFRLLNARPMVRIGVLSYALYLFQQPFLAREGKLVEWLPLWARVLAPFVCALVAHEAIEKPFLAMKDRFTSRRARAAARPPNDAGTADTVSRATGTGA